jgi:hypothetical protein
MTQRYRVESGSLGSYDLRQKPVAASFKHSNEPSTSITAGNFLLSWAPANFSRQTLFHEVGWSLPTQLFVLRMKIKEPEVLCFPCIPLNTGLQRTANTNCGVH